MAEESLIPKNLQKTSYIRGGLDVFLRLALLIFLVVAVLTGGLYLYRNFLANSLARARADLKKLEVEFDPITILELERVSNSIAASRELLRAHPKSPAVFNLIEANVLPAVSFNTFSLSSEKKTVILLGESASYADVSAQAGVFEALPEISNVTFSNLGLREAGTVGFTLNMVLK